jgi:hypothetical protein
MTTAVLVDYLLAADQEELFTRLQERQKEIGADLLAELESRLRIASRGEGPDHPGWIAAVGVFASTAITPSPVDYFIYFVTAQMLITTFELSEERGSEGAGQQKLDKLLSAQPELRRIETVKRRMVEGVFTAMQAAINLRDLDTCLGCVEWGKTACRELEYPAGEFYLKILTLNVAVQLKRVELARRIPDKVVCCFVGKKAQKYPRGG